MNIFIIAMHELGYKCANVNKKSDQSGQRIDCGLRSLECNTTISCKILVNF
jgi:hypothetical protein